MVYREGCRVSSQLELVSLVKVTLYFKIAFGQSVLLIDCAKISLPSGKLDFPSQQKAFHCDPWD